MDDRVYNDWRQEWIDNLESRIWELDNENIRLRKALEHVATTDTTVDENGIWLIDGKTFKTWVADVLNGNENCDGLKEKNE